MEKRERIERLAQTEEDQVLLARLYDRLHGAACRNVPSAGPFLSLRELALARQLLAGPEFQAFGGYEGAERTVLCHIPDYLDREEYLYGEDGPIRAVSARYYERDSLSHRDFLGALMGAGIKRETVGDILVRPGLCQFLVTREIAPHILQSLESAGRTKLHLSPLPLSELSPPEAETKEFHATVAALRLDSVTAAGFGLARGPAAQHIEAGRAAVNGLPCDKPDRLLREGDRVTVRGLGKIELKTVGGTTRKGRTGVTILRYV